MKMAVYFEVPFPAFQNSFLGTCSEQMFVFFRMKIPVFTRIFKQVRQDRSQNQMWVIAVPVKVKMGQEIHIEFIDQLGAWEIPFVLVFTKTDKNKPGATQRNVDAFLGALAERWEEPPPFFLTSAVDKMGREEVLGYIASLNRNFVKL